MSKSIYNIIRGSVIMALCVSLGQNMYFYFKYDEALNSLLICTTSQYGKVEAGVKDIAEQSGLKDVVNNHTNSKSSGLLQEVNSSLYNDLSKKAEQVGIDKEQLDKDIQQSGFSAEVIVKGQK